MTSQSDSPWLTAEQTAKRTGFAAGTLAHWRCEGLGPRYVKVNGGAVRYHRDDVDSWLRNRQHDPLEEILAPLAPEIRRNLQRALPRLRREHPAVLVGLSTASRIAPDKIEELARHALNGNAGAPLVIATPWAFTLRLVDAMVDALEERRRLLRDGQRSATAGVLDPENWQLIEAALMENSDFRLYESDRQHGISLRGGGHLTLWRVGLTTIPTVLFERAVGESVGMRELLASGALRQVPGGDE